MTQGMVLKVTLFTWVLEIALNKGSSSTSEGGEFVRRGFFSRSKSVSVCVSVLKSLNTLDKFVLSKYHFIKSTYTVLFPQGEALVVSISTVRRN